MNWVLILVIAILAGYTLTGFAKGFLKIAYSLVSWVVIVVFVICATPYIHNYLKNNTDIYNKVAVYCEEVIREQAEQKAAESGGEASVLGENEIFAAIAEKLPQNLLQEVKEKTNEITSDLMEGYGLYNKTAIAMADLVIQGIAAIVAMIGGIVVSMLISAVLGVVTRLPLIGSANKILGLAAGAVNGLLIVWFAFYLVAVLCTTKFGSAIIAHIYASGFLTFLYENNMILSILN